MPRWRPGRANSSIVADDVIRRILQRTAFPPRYLCGKGARDEASFLNSLLADRHAASGRAEVTVRCHRTPAPLMRDFHARSVTLTHSQRERVGVDPMSGEKARVRLCLGLASDALALPATDFGDGCAAQRHNSVACFLPANNRDSKQHKLCMHSARSIMS